GRRYDAVSSLSLNFEAASEAPVPQRYAAVRIEPVETLPTAPEPPAPEGKLIEFPKPMPVASVTLAPPMPLADELAETILEIETPRILDVPEGAHALPE